MTSTKTTGYRGVSPEKVSKVIVMAASGEIKPDEYDDADIRGYY